MAWQRQENYEIKNPERKAFWALVKVIFKGEVHNANSGGAFGKKGKNGEPRKRSRAGRIASTVVLVILYLFLAAMIGSAGGGMAWMGVPIETIFRSALIMTLLFNVLFGIFSAVTYLYYPKDLPFYLSLPYSAKMITQAKFLHFFVLTLLGSLLVLPMVVVALAVKAAPPLQYVTAIAGYMAGAAACDIMITIITILLMRFSTFARNKDRFMTMVSILSMVFGIGIGVGSQFLVGNSSETGFTQVLGALGNASAVPLPLEILISLFCFPLFYYKLFFAASLWEMLLSLLLTLVLTFVYFKLLMFCADLFYLPGVLALQGAGGKKHTGKLSPDKLRLALRPSGRMSQAYASYQWKKLIRVPTFFTQMVLSPLIIPAVILVTGLVSFSIQMRREGGADWATIFAEIHRFMAQLSLETPEFSYLVFGVLGWLALSAMGSAISFKLAVSTDGQDFFLFRTLPAKPESYLLGIQKTFLLLNLLPNLAVVIILMIVCRMQWVQALLLLLNGMSVFYSLSMFYLILGMISPQLEWESENALVKGNPKMVLLVYSGILVGAVLSAPQVLLLVLNMNFRFMPQAAAFGLSFALNIGLAALATWIYYGPAKRRLLRVEG